MIGNMFRDAIQRFNQRNNAKNAVQLINVGFQSSLINSFIKLVWVTNNFQHTNVSTHLSQNSIEVEFEQRVTLLLLHKSSNLALIYDLREALAIQMNTQACWSTVRSDYESMMKELQHDVPLSVCATFCRFK